MNITKSFVEYLEANSMGVFGTDLFIGGAPLGAQEKIKYVVPSGGVPTLKAHTGEKKKNYLITVYFRNKHQQELYDEMQAFEEFINRADCPTLTGFNVIEIEATSLPTDGDGDAQEVTIGAVEVTITTYQELI